MQVFAGMSDRVGLREVIGYAQRVESLGYDGLHVPETVHDGMAASLLALEHTSRLIVRTSVILAFPRSPMLTAFGAWDLAAFSGGRFQLGLGTQIKQNIVGRFSVPWTEPVTRMRDYVDSLRAIWRSFQQGEPLSYASENYTFTRLQPFFNPGPLTVPPPPIWLGGVNEGMVGLAGSHADGIVTHPTNSNPRYLREICLPALEAGRAHRAPDASAVDPFPIVVGSQYITGPTRADVDRNREHHRRLFAFLYSTPPYRRTLALHGWNDLGERLQLLTRTQEWDTLQELVTDEVLDALVPQGTWDQLPDVIERWFGGLCTGVILPLPEDPADDARFAEVIAAVQAG
ncbi:MAG: class F420-dependent oxidoreductase [Ilumatobacteraceae bacterium]|nr:class F420-dependent oxidoreductase [Ilumatobacteraceae bacterium]MCU1387541.1 class F420-dependent oxidoreductase [Ilumatobacteraceae bacterium]